MTKKTCNISVTSVEPEFLHFNPLQGGGAHLVIDLGRAVFSTENPEIDSQGNAVISLGVILLPADIETIIRSLQPFVDAQAEPDPALVEAIESGDLDADIT